MPERDSSGRFVSGSVADRAKALVAERIDEVMRGTALELQSRIMQRTPVDTGRARANWNATTGSANTTTDLGATEADVPAKQQEGSELIRVTGFANGEHLFLANGLPYIESLENGSSAQAPSGMVALTIEELTPVVEQLAREVSRGE